MHEMSMTINLIKYLVELVKNKGAKKIDEVYIELGTLTHLNPEQIMFLYNIFSNNYPELKGSKIFITRRDTKIKCLDCGYNGEIAKEDSEYLIFLFRCPKCESGRIKILEGDEFLVKRVKLIMS